MQTTKGTEPVWRLSFMLFTFAALAVAFYELSGGSDFEPPAPRGAEQNALRAKVAQEEIELRDRSTQATEVVLTTEEELEPALIGLPTLEDVAEAAEEGARGVLQDAVTQTVAALLEEEPATLAPPADLRVVTGDRVNMRAGPGTDFGVITQLVRGQEAEVLQDPGTGWVEIRVSTSGEVGWMANWLMEPVN
ncbi:MAG: SH3 domain-containing protein [Pseudomonadota bacterium]